MAALFSRSSKALPYLTGAAVVGAAGTAYYATRRPMMLDSASNAPTKTMAFPKTMLFSQTLTVTSSEQINHDTKRITFKLPGGSSEISGVPAGCTFPSVIYTADTNVVQPPSSHNTPHQEPGSPYYDPIHPFPTPTPAARFNSS